MYCFLFNFGIILGLPLTLFKVAAANGLHIEVAAPNGLHIEVAAPNGLHIEVATPNGAKPT